MIVAGVMSGTSADGINVALVRLSDKKPAKSAGLSLRLIGHSDYPYPRKVREAVLAAMNATRASVADLSRLNCLLGELNADAVMAAQKQFHVKIDLVGCHGQTLYHQGEAAPFLGRKIASTWQTGESAIIAARVGAPVVSDFRPADMAAGGKGAPLVSFLDYLLFADPRIGRVVQNIGGIANLTAIPMRAAADDLIAFDTGPGNMVIDAVTHKLFGRPYDRDGKIAAAGVTQQRILSDVLRHSFFRRPPPKTAGREEFGREFVREFLRRCGGLRKQDIVATATALTARSVADAVQRFVIGPSAGEPRHAYRDMVLSGGGTKNPTLVAMLAHELKPTALRVRVSDEFGLPSQAKEAVAFAVLAYQTWHRRPSNVPSATGARQRALLGKISY
jgi:anhydro-N-acetylmuramic acid kinase